MFKFRPNVLGIIRKLNGKLTIKEAAKIVGIPADEWENYENGLSELSVSTLLKITNKFPFVEPRHFFVDSAD